jgi:hypothetical protein
MHIFCHIFLSNYWCRNLVFGHKLHIGTPYRGKRFWTHRIPTSCLSTLLIFLHIEQIYSFFVAFFSASIEGRNLIFGHKLHIGTPYRGKRFWTHRIPTSCLPTLLIFLHIEHIYSFFCRIFLSNYWGQKSDIWSQASYRYPISWEAFLNPSDSYFLFADFLDFYTHWTYMLIFLRIFLSNYWWQKSDIWSQASYKYPISWEAFFDPSDSYFLFAKERGYHRWALAHSSSCLEFGIYRILVYFKFCIYRILVYCTFTKRGIVYLVSATPPKRLIGVLWNFTQLYYTTCRCAWRNMVAVQNLKGEIIQLILSRKGGGACTL